MKHTLLLIALFGFSVFANANDSAAIRLAGQIEFKKTSDIAMLTEDLVISPNKVRVNYTFRNDSGQDIEEMIAFPIQEETYEELDLEEYVKQIDFRLNSNAPVSAVQHEVKMTNDHLIRVVFHWKQTFPAGKIVTVSHEYQSSGGFIIPSYPKDGDKTARSFVDDYKKGKEWQSMITDYCIEPELDEWTFQHGQLAQQVHYILTTGANWKAPIQHFKLTIKKDRPEQKVSLCADNIKKIDNTTFEFRQDNFLPTRDLRVLFLNPPQ